MNNSYPSGRSYSNHSPAADLANFRRSSYASVAAGTAPASNPQSPPANLGTLSQLLRDESANFGSEREQGFPYTRSPFAGPFAMPPTKSATDRAWARTPYSDPWPDDHLSTLLSDFVCPSYLRNSRYAERLEAEHRAELAALKDARRQGRQAHHAKDTPPSASISTSSSTVNLHKLPSAFARSSGQDAIERLPPLKSDDALRKLPSRWSESDKCPGLDLLAGGLEVKFQGAAKANDEAATIRSDYPMPSEVGLYYFEVTILSRGKEGLIGVGFSGPNASLTRLPGWEPESWAYHGDDGFSFSCTASGKSYGPKFSSSDVVGCGVNFRTGSAFFTKNGLYLGEAFHNVRGDRLYPSVGVKKPGEHLRVNFGAMPFVFDIDAMMEGERSKIRSDINNATLAPFHTSLDERSLIQELIAQYLAHDGYVETARAFADEVHGQRASLSEHSKPLKMFDPSQDIHAIERQKIRAAILEGDIDKALKYITTYYPYVLEKAENRDVYFKLRCRKFIEMMRRSTEMHSTPSSVMATKALGKSADNHNGQAMPQQPDHRRSSHVQAQKGDAELDHQMELDEQLQRESQPPKIPPVSAFEPIDTNLTFSTPDNPDSGDSMDMTPDTLSAQESQQREKSAIISHHSLLTDALEYGRELKAEFSNDHRPAMKQALNDTFALIAYTDARDSIVGGLMEGKGRVEIAEEVNAAILVSLGKSSSAALETLCAQAEVLVDMLSADGGPGAFVNVTKDCLRR